MPTILGSKTTASGNITIINSVPTGTATAGSAVEITLNGMNTLAIQVTGTYTGALSLQLTIDGTTWVTVSNAAALVNAAGAQSATIASATQGIFQADVGGFTKARITGLAAMSGTAVVTLQSVSGAAALVGLDGPIPIGTNSIGNLGTVSTVSTVTAVTSVNAVIPGVGATNLGKAEDAVHASGDTGIMMLGVRTDAPTAAIATTTGDYIPPVMDSLGRIWVNNILANTIDAGHTHFRTTSLVAVAQQIKSGAGNLYSLNIINTNTTAVYVKIYNILSASVTVGTSPISKTFLVPAGVVGNPGVLRTSTDASPLFYFSTGLSVAATGALADADTTAVTASTVYLEAIYK